MTFDGSYDNCLVLVHTDAGVTGIAEVDSVPSVIRAIIDAPRSHTHAMGLKEVLVGAGPLQTSRPVGPHVRLRPATTAGAAPSSMPSAPSTSRSGTCAARSRASRSPTCWAARKRDRVLAYGTVYPLGETPDEVRRNIDRGLKLGLKAIKIVADPFWRDDLDKTAMLIRTAREHVGPDIRLMVDAATAWAKAEDGLPLMPIFRDNDFLWVEAPLPLDDLDGHARFQGFGVPIGGGDLGLTTRFEYEQTFDVGKIDIAQPDVTMAGGITELMRIAALAKTRGKRVVTHGYKSNITIAANLAFLSQHWDGRALRIFHQPVAAALGADTREAFPIGADGRIAVPETPGTWRQPRPGDGREVPDWLSVTISRRAARRPAPR